MRECRPPGREGLQPERTRLAWRRTTLACTVAAVLAVKAALRSGFGVGHLAVCALCLVLWLAFVATAHLRVQAMSATVPHPLALRIALLIVLCTVGLAVCGVGVVL